MLKHCPKNTRRDLINEFDSAVSSLENISAEDYKILLSSISQESTMKIHKLLDSSISEPEKFNKDIHAIIENERNNKLNTEKKHKEEINKNKKLQEANKDLLKKLTDISQQIADIQENQRLDKLQQKEKDKRTRRWIWVIISIVVVLVTLLLLQIFPNITNYMRKGIQIIGGLGGFWGFCNLGLNIWSKFKSH